MECILGGKVKRSPNGGHLIMDKCVNFGIFRKIGKNRWMMMMKFLAYKDPLMAGHLNGVKSKYFAFGD